MKGSQPPGERYDTQLGTPGSGYCPGCKETTQQTLKLYDPNETDGLKVWQCDTCGEQTEFE